MKLTFIKTIACFMVLSVTPVAVMQTSAQAMLAPARLADTIQDIKPSDDLRTIEKALESKELRARLHALGLSDADIETRLSHLSDQQKHQLASQIHAVNPAGDVLFGVLILVVLVLLVIFLIRHI